MTKINLKVNGASATATLDGVLTSGMIGIPVIIEYDQEWSGLLKTCVFRVGSFQRDRKNISEQTTVPWEVMRHYGKVLEIGVEGRSDDGDIVIPTIWAKVGTIKQGANATVPGAPNPEQEEAIAGVGRPGSVIGSEVFNDYEKNRAISELSSASGSENIAGLTGYFFYSVDFENKVMVLTKVFDVAPAEPFETGYEVGDVLTIIASDHFYDCATITAIDNNTITVDSLPFSTIPSSGTGRKSVFCFEKPDVGAVTHFGKCATAEGYQNESFGLYGHSEGYKNKTLGYYGHTEGRENIAYFSAHAEGIRNKAIARYAHAEGESTTASGRGAHTEGQKTEATSWYAHAEGNGSKAKGFASHAEGQGTEASGNYSHSEGEATTASGSHSHAEGYEAKATGNYSHAEGVGTSAVGDYQHVQGIWNEESEEYLHIVGNGADNDHRSNAHTIDRDGNAWYAGTVSGKDPVRQSNLTTKKYVDAEISGAKSYAKKYVDDNTAGKKYPQSTGGEIFNAGPSINKASGQYSHAEGFATKAEGDYSHAEGSDTEASGSRAHAEGATTKATHPYTHAEGYGSKATWDCAHAEGNNTQASNYASHAEGNATQATGSYSHAEGNHTIASGTAQHVQGTFNIQDTEDEFAHIIGNGADNDHRSNAHTVDWEGNAWYAGTVETTAIILKSPNGTRFSIGVNDDGTLVATAL